MSSCFEPLCYPQHTSSLLSIWSLLHSSKLWSVELTHPYFSSFCSYLISIHHSTPKCHLITLQPRSPCLPLLLHPTARPPPAASVKRLLTKLGPLACKHHKADRQPPAAPSVYEREHISKLEALQRGENHQHHSPANSISAIQAATPQQDDNSVNALSVSRDAATGCPRGLGHINYLMSFFIAIHQC